MISTLLLLLVTQLGTTACFAFEPRIYRIVGVEPKEEEEVKELHKTWRESDNVLYYSNDDKFGLRRSSKNEVLGRHLVPVASEGPDGFTRAEAVKILKSEPARNILVIVLPSSRKMSTEPLSNILLGLDALISEAGFKRTIVVRIVYERGGDSFTDTHAYQVLKDTHEEEKLHPTVVSPKNE